MSMETLDVCTVQLESDPLLNSDCASTTSMDSHAEPHFGSAEIIRDVIVGLSDGLTVPFALAAGLAALENSRLVVVAGAAEVIAGSISMALGGFMAGLSEIEHYDSERKRELWEVEHVPEKEIKETIEIFEPYGIKAEELQGLLAKFRQDPESWVDFMMRFELNLEKPEKNRSWISALTIGLSYFIGGLVPLAATDALLISAMVTIFALFVFGYVKSVLLGNAKPLVGAIQMMLIGTVAALAAYGIAKAIPNPTI